MKRLIPIILLIFFTIIGLSFLIMVLRMVWFPPSSMGMMMGMRMGRNMMLQHMLFMFGQIFSIFLIITGFLTLIWLLLKNNNKK